MVICLEQGACQMTPLPVTVSCFSKIQIGFTFLVRAHPGSPGKMAVKRVCVCVCVCEGACVCVCSITHSLFHSRLKTFLFSANPPPLQPFLMQTPPRHLLHDGLVYSCYTPLHDTANYHAAGALTR